MQSRTARQQLKYDKRSNETQVPVRFPHRARLLAHPFGGHLLVRLSEVESLHPALRQHPRSNYLFLVDEPNTRENS